MQALIGYIHRVYNPNMTGPSDVGMYVFTGQESGWSSTQTVTIPEAAVPPETPAFTVTTDNNSTILLNVTNQPFTGFFDYLVGNFVSLYYNVRVKFPADQNWTTLYRVEDMPLQSDSTSSNYTALSYPLVDQDSHEYFLGDKMLALPTGSQLEFQVQALVGFVFRVDSATGLYPYVFNGAASDWSATQTLTIGANPSPSASNSPSPSLSPSPTVPEFPPLASVGLLVAGAILFAMFCKRKTSGFTNSRL